MRNGSSEIQCSWMKSDLNGSLSSFDKSSVEESKDTPAPVVHQQNNHQQNNHLHKKTVCFDDRAPLVYRSAAASALRRYKVSRHRVLAALWYGADEYAAFRQAQAKDSKQVIRECRNSSHSKDNDEEDETSTCCSTSTSTTSSNPKAIAFRSYLEYSLQMSKHVRLARGLGPNPSPPTNDDDDDEPMTVPHANFVGLERMISRQLMKDKRQRRTQVVRAVLEAQTRLTVANSSSSDATLQIAQASRSVSRMSVLMAECFARTAFHLTEA